jgi:hypothetical protein
MRRRWLGVALPGVFLCAASPSSAAAQATLNAGSAEVAPGSTAAVPIAIVLPAGTSCATLQFNLTVVAGTGAPALPAPVTFTSSVGMPTLNVHPGNATVLVAWISNFSPLLTGTARVGTLEVPIPAAAQGGQTYAVTVVNPSGTTDGETDLPMRGASGSIDIVTTPRTPTPTSTLTPTGTSTAVPIAVCDVSPSAGNDAGQFGNATVNNADVDAIFKASLLGPPPAHSVRFSAMDAVTADAPPVCGGDGTIKNNDVIACFKRSLLPAEPMYVRTFSGETCTAAQR